ncbi:MAG: hypothetical protein LKF71_02310 [Oscillospiraceae bacterium]|jgi:flagellar biogenesis protein FliO|nr:hypothetical protein [Oscillospiraceae bacterium]
MSKFIKDVVSLVCAIAVIVVLCHVLSFVFVFILRIAEVLLVIWLVAYVVRHFRGGSSARF